jgi:O-acetyl-ADP-ribose deacetylase
VVFGCFRHYNKTMPLNIIRHDITKLHVDAIVNAANPQLLPGAGVCEAIFKAAGYDAMAKACLALAPVQPGQAVLTPGFDLPTKFVIHAVGPIYQDGQHGEANLLRQAYLNSLRLAEDHGCESIAFPLIANGVYQYPATDVLTIALSTLRTYLKTHELNVTLVVYDRKAFEISEALLGDIESYIDEHYVDDMALTIQQNRRQESAFYSDTSLSEVDAYAAPRSKRLDDLFDHLDESFTSALFRLIDQKGLKDPEVYKKANLDRKHFSKIRSNAHYVPSKPTAIALALALELNLSETETLLRKAGLALSSSSKFDVLITYFVSNRMYNIDKVNEVLFHYDQPLLGA